MVEIQNVHNIKELKSFQFKFLKKNKTKQMAGLCSVIAPTTAQDTWNNRTQKQRGRGQQGIEAAIIWEVPDIPEPFSNQHSPDTLYLKAWAGVWAPLYI